MLGNAPVIAILPAADIEGTKKFYTEKLGLQPADVSTVGNSVLFECGEGTRLYLYERETGTKADHTVAGWMVEDVPGTVEELRKKGIVFEQFDMPGMKTDERGIVEMDGTETAFFKDPEGNILSITETVE
jgi:catechol 2,3-dioxygenase-like lactoylglutathione lyase family enzyme